MQKFFPLFLALILMLPGIELRGNNKAAPTSNSTSYGEPETKYQADPSLPPSPLLHDNGLPGAGHYNQNGTAPTN